MGDGFSQWCFIKRHTLSWSTTHVVLVNEARSVGQRGTSSWATRPVLLGTFLRQMGKCFVFMFTSFTTFTFPLLMGVGDGELRGEGSGSAFTA